jgi:cytochrome c556
MAGIQEPGMLLLQRSVRGAGPQSDDDWGAVTMNAALMNEIGFMLVQNERAKDAVWTKAATDLRAASAAFHAASEKKDLAAMRAELPKLSASCQECHTVHRK